MATQQQALDEAARRASLWSVPYLADADVPAALNCPPTLWALQKRLGDSPPLFTIGRRVYVRTDDLRAWLDKKAASGAPGSRRHRESAKAAA
jgi:hypothetical protein